MVSLFQVVLGVYLFIYLVPIILVILLELCNYIVDTETHITSKEWKRLLNPFSIFIVLYKLIKSIMR